MTDRPKPKSANSKTLNTDRPNGKRSKSGASHTRKTHLTEVQKVLLGAGDYRSFPGVGWEPSTQNSPVGRKGS